MVVHTNLQSSQSSLLNNFVKTMFGSRCVRGNLGECSYLGIYNSEVCVYLFI